MRQNPPVPLSSLLSCLVVVICLSGGCGQPPPLEAPDPEAAGEAWAQDGPEATLVEDERALRWPRLRVTLFDVGQGDGLLVELPNGRTLSIDGGPDTSRYADLLAGRGVRALDAMVLTHAHADHYRGLLLAADLLPGDCGRRVLDPGYDRAIAGYQQFRTAAGCRYRQLYPGQSVPLDPSVQISVLYASDELRPRDQSHGINNTSVALRLGFRRFSMLLTGDGEVEAEETLYLDRGSGLRSTVLKLGHHGSCTASARRFLQAVSPRYVVLSVGQGNAFGMPHCQTMGKLAALRGRGLRWARTDRNGAVRVVTDGYSFAVERARGAESQDDYPRDCADPLEF